MLDSLKTGIRNPELFAMEALKYYRHTVRGRSFCYVMGEDWDNLIILDGCRADLFKNVDYSAKSFEQRISPASCTRSWLGECFSGEYPDTVYISANPQTQIHNAERQFFRSIRVWDDCWDDNLNTARPSDVTNRAIEIGRQHPNKRVIVHYVQPHYPFIGETGRKLEQRGFHEKARRGEAVKDVEEPTVWDQLADGLFKTETVWQAYRENLELVIPHVERFVNEIEGKTVVSSDHGNALGEWGVFGHPCGHYLPSLVDVPWLEMEYSSRKSVIEGELQQEYGDPDVAVGERLADLGYR